MTINVGDSLPNTTFYEMGDNGPETRTTDDLFKGKKVALFGLPGAFTPTCTAQHVPGYVDQADALAAKGIDSIICVAVNDAFVMHAWGVSLNVGDKVRMISDGSAEFAKATGLDLDLSARGFGLRCKRFSMVVNDGTVERIEIDPEGLDKTSCETMLMGL